MNRDTAVFSSCTFLLGLVIGSLLIGPHLKKFGNTPQASATVAADAPAAAEQSNPMEAVRTQIGQLKDAIARNPRNFDALAQLGGMYMDAAKYPQAIDYIQQALAVHEDPGLRTDLGICYKQNGQLDKALAAFQKASAEAPEEWQALYNEAVVLGEMKRFDEARTLVPRLQKLRPDDPNVQKLAQALSGEQASRPQ